MYRSSLSLSCSRLFSRLCPLDLEACLVSRLNRRDALPGHVSVVGEPNEGTRELLLRLSRQLQDCVILLRMTDELVLGWEEAPFEGTFTPRTSTAPWNASLPDILKERPPGCFVLTLPTSMLAERSHDLDRLRAAVSLELRRLVFAPATHSTETRITLLVENGHCLCDDAVYVWSRFGRDKNCALVVAQPDLADIQSDVSLTSEFVVAFQSSLLAAPAAEKLLKLPNGTLARLPGGQGWCANRVAGKTQWFRLGPGTDVA